ncbi:biliverdin-producing heme oxygenase [Paucibacter sp. R3-3]|uniref:Biliverdin-producing heme oxygenase n=1 Tax=Roseateles agri TaxID=3098619 RepID=A0ABU5DJE6_9BURK|nr:biliverdin-producing heme oxygenase [Paucibacter sp. R3-3]MDY0746402.1 biliverdin-producing heme oxygenase [Paucibacter sp. R3-3]
MNTSTLESRARRLRGLTHEAHGALDHLITGFDPFAGRESYACFLRMQYCFLRDVDALFTHPELNRLFPGLAERRRLTLVELDLLDLGVSPPELTARPMFSGEAVDIATALGWLYVEEGSNLGAAILFKRAAALGLDGTFGARHLAPRPAGRAPSWHAFVAQLDAAELDASGETRAAAGATAAFRQVYGYVESYCTSQR